MRTALTTVKIAVVAPIPSARVTSAMEVNIGARPNLRNTCFRDLMGTNTSVPPIWFGHKRHFILFDSR